MNPAVQVTSTTTSSTVASSSRSVISRIFGRRRALRDFFSVGTVVDGVEFTTTKAVLNIESLTLHAPESILIVSSDKATTYHGHVGHAHLYGAKSMYMVYQSTIPTFP